MKKTLAIIFSAIFCLMSLCVPASAAYYGDVNGDDSVNSLDAAFILRYDAGIITEEIPAGDVNGDGSVNSLDAALVLRYDAGLIEGFGVIPVLPSGIVLSSDKSNVLISYGEKVYFYALTAIKEESLKLYAGDELVAEMYDDGNFSAHGDDMAGDGIYSACVLCDATEDTSVTYTASFGTEVSNEITVDYYTEISYATLMSIDNVTNTIDDIMLSEDFENQTDEEKKTAIENALLELEANEDIVEGSIIFNAETNMYSFMYPEGIMGGVSYEGFDGKFNGSNNIGKMNFSELQTSNAPLTSAKTTDTNGDIGSAIILNSFPSFETEEEDIEYRTTFYEEVKEDWDAIGLKTTLDTDVTVSDYLNIDDYNVVCISTHGCVYSWPDGSSRETPAFCLSELNIDGRYSVELKDKQLAVHNGRYYILPGFFTENFADNAFANTFVFSESCESFGKGMNYDYSMANAFINRSAKDYAGFHNSVLATYSREFMKTYVDELIDGDTTEVAFQTAVNTYGSNHEIWFNNIYSYTWEQYIEIYQEYPRTYDEDFDIAYPNRHGNDDDATLIHTGLKNGNFDSFDASTTAPTFWSAEGDVRTVLQLGDVVSENERMAIITTGVGAKTTSSIGVGTEGSLIKQTFVVPHNASLLSFDYNLVSEEPMEYVGSKYNDAFGIQLIQNGETAYETIYESINSSTWYAVDGINFSGGDSTVYQTGWKSTVLDVSEYQGKTITLCFIIYDVGDSLYDSACVIDNIKLQ